VPGLAAREVAVSALGTVYALSATADDTRQALTPLIASSWSLATALSLLAWFVFAPQCLSTLAAVKRETGGWRYLRRSAAPGLLRLAVRQARASRRGAASGTRGGHRGPDATGGRTPGRCAAAGEGSGTSTRPRPSLSPAASRRSAGLPTTALPSRSTTGRCGRSWSGTSALK
jgi:hypothetical protein